MPRHPDAIGFLNDLAGEVNERWFTMICDLAATNGVITPDQPTYDILFALYTRRASYIGVKPVAAGSILAAPPVPIDFLEELSSFTNFKLLGDSLGVAFRKRISLIFGANGSGKSSLCESLKILATPGPPVRPLENVRTSSGVMPAFRFKFRSDAKQQTWTPAAGYGPRQETVKYFDTEIAIQNVTNAVEPGRVIVLAPFKLHVFEWAKAITNKFRASLQKAQQDNETKLIQRLTAIRTEFTKFKGRPLALIDEKTATLLSGEIELGEEFKDRQLFADKQSAADELEKASSGEGLKLLRAEHRELESLLTALNTLLNLAAEIWALEPATKANTLLEKQTAQEVLTKELVLEGGTLDGLLGLLRSASPMCKMDEATGQVCPLCKRGLGVAEVALFKQYYGVLAGELEQSISAIKAEIAKAREIALAVGQIDRVGWDKCTTIPEAILSAAKSGSELVLASCDISKAPTEEAKAALESLKASVIVWATQLESKRMAIEAAARGRGELVNRLTKLRAELEPLEYAQAINDRLVTLRGVEQMVAQSQFWSNSLRSFTQLLKRITEKAKHAYEELVVADFETRLDREYMALAEKGMAAFGVVLARKGTEAAVTVLPHVGGKSIEGVLSEGEQRLHALALFFAELETCSQSVLVFDDPISSFDYNYIANYCARLRDFAVKFPGRQIIVLTHNWEFFVQFQTTLNSGGLNTELSVQVLERCSTVAEYSEKLDELKADLIAILALPGEPTKPQKEEMAGKMRRMIEAVVNTHVFNSQRQQYKQRKHSVSEFHHYTKLVRLEPAEATILRDLFAKLSITEHDDARNAYVNTDKTTFQYRYNSILAIEAAVISRR